MRSIMVHTRNHGSSQKYECWYYFNFASLHYTLSRLLEMWFHMSYKSSKRLQLRDNLVKLSFFGWRVGTWLHKETSRSKHLLDVTLRDLTTFFQPSWQTSTNISLITQCAPSHGRNT